MDVFMEFGAAANTNYQGDRPIASANEESHFDFLRSKELAGGVAYNEEETHNQQQAVDPDADQAHYHRTLLGDFDDVLEDEQIDDQFSTKKDSSIAQSTTTAGHHKPAPSNDFAPGGPARKNPSLKVPRPHCNKPTGRMAPCCMSIVPEYSAKGLATIPPGGIDYMDCSDRYLTELRRSGISIVTIVQKTVNIPSDAFKYQIARRLGGQGPRPGTGLAKDEVQDLKNTFSMRIQRWSQAQGVLTVSRSKSRTEPIPDSFKEALMHLSDAQIYHNTIGLIQPGSFTMSQPEDRQHWTPEEPQHTYPLPAPRDIHPVLLYAQAEAKKASDEAEAKKTAAGKAASRRKQARAEKLDNTGEQPLLQTHDRCLKRQLVKEGGTESSKKQRYSAPDDHHDDTIDSAPSFFDNYGIPEGYRNPEDFNITKEPAIGQDGRFFSYNPQPLESQQSHPLLCQAIAPVYGQYEHFFDAHQQYGGQMLDGGAPTPTSGYDSGYASSFLAATPDIANEYVDHLGEPQQSFAMLHQSPMNNTMINSPVHNYSHAESSNTGALDEHRRAWDTGDSQLSTPEAAINLGLEFLGDPVQNWFDQSLEARDQVLGFGAGADLDYMASDEWTLSLPAWPSRSITSIDPSG
ncbi:hypothetical protein FKW77_005334 [Venturia effusa]|uniref:Uncharacterized protein n=1 Tax=Venturia effusa TaxID=50376 RepID=A0A517LLI2_9PEZI|nr:hypothetical protein FKW77_005334 [Venturia effusa]